MSRKHYIVLVVMILTPGLLLVACQIYQESRVQIREPILIDLTVKDTPWNPVMNVTLTTREKGWRYLVPIPWTWQWITKGNIRKINTDNRGHCTLNFKDDYLSLETVMSGTYIIQSYEIVFHRYDGKVTTSESPFSWAYGFYPMANNPYRLEYELIIKNPEQSNQGDGA